MDVVADVGGGGGGGGVITAGVAVAAAIAVAVVVPVSMSESLFPPPHLLGHNRWPPSLRSLAVGEGQTKSYTNPVFRTP